MQIVYTKQTFPDGHIWYTSSVLVKATPEKQVAFIQKQADKHGIKCRYELVTRAEYMAGRAKA